MAKNTLAYFDCGHALLDTSGQTSAVKLPAHLAPSQLVPHLAVELRKTTQILCYPARFCGLCHPQKLTFAYLAEVINAALEDDGLPRLSTPQLKAEIPKYLRGYGWKEDAITGLLLTAPAN